MNINKLIRLKLENCLCIWDPYHQGYKNKLELVQRRAARFICKDIRRQSHISDMLKDINWKMLEDRRTISRLTLLYKSVHNKVAINIDEHYTNHEKGNITTSKTSLIFITHPTARKNWYRCSFMPRTVVEWNHLPATIREAQSVDTLRVKLCSIELSTHFTRNKIAWSRPLAATYVLLQPFIPYVEIWL